MLVFWKELKIVSFDPALAAAMGFSVPVVHYLLMAMVAGVTRRVVRVGRLDPGRGDADRPGGDGRTGDRPACRGCSPGPRRSASSSAVFGYVLAAALDTSVAGMMAVVAGVQLTGAVFLGPHYGLVSRWLRNLSLAVRIASEDVIARLYREEEQGSGFGVQGSGRTGIGERAGAYSDGERGASAP